MQKPGGIKSTASNIRYHLILIKPIKTLQDKLNTILYDMLITSENTIEQLYMEIKDIFIQPAKVTNMHFMAFAYALLYIIVTPRYTYSDTTSIVLLPYLNIGQFLTSPLEDTTIFVLFMLTLKLYVVQY